MIYTGQDSKAQPSKGPQQGPSRSSPAQAPPAYNETIGYRATPPVQPPYPQLPIQSGIVIVRTESARRRFFRAFAVAVGIWLLLSILTRTTVHLGRYRDGDWDSDWKFDIPSTVDIDHCVQGDQWTPSIPFFNASGVPFGHSSETTFNLSLPSKTLFFLSRGQQLGGVVEVKTSRDQPRDSANVHVVLRYNYEKVVERIKACLLEREDNENGVGIFGPVYHRQPRWEYSTTFEITITLPDLGRSAPLYINNFETDFPNTRHDIKELSNKVLFKTISLSGSNGRIEAESIKMINGKIRTSNGAISGAFETNNTLSLLTSNGPISGVFETNKRLSLITSNGAIRADVNLKGEKDTIPEFVARSSNSPIEANIRLTSTSRQGGSFDVSASTSNSHLELKFPESPVDSNLELDASTSNGRATVDLNSAYEGSFVLRTSATSSIAVDEHRKAEDPSGKNRQRVVNIRERSRGYVSGSAIWDPSSEGHFGRVSVKTSNAPVYLVV